MNKKIFVLGIVLGIPLILLGVAFTEDTFVLSGNTDNVVGIPLLIVGGIGLIGGFLGLWTAKR